MKIISCCNPTKYPVDVTLALFSVKSKSSEIKLSNERVNEPELMPQASSYTSHQQRLIEADIKKLLPCS